ncbi:glycoside hydrolase family 43 protein [Reichenbachiella sp.]|uniref:glycoside hydrolase family 43 protein n=1 Tax=Reichenbachiella sp. TaxID=2184521 RepID=UPI00329873AE
MKEQQTEKEVDFGDLIEKSISQPLVNHIYSADPSAHVFGGKIYIYPSHDIDAGIPFNDNGDHFGMQDYHVFSMNGPENLEAKDHGVALDIKDVKWAERQMWAPDVAEKDGKYYFYFPAKAHDGLFRIGLAIGNSPEGPFAAESEAIKGSYSIDPAVFRDEDNSYYMYFGGLWGGQLQKYRKNAYGVDNDLQGDDEMALGPRVAKMSEDMKEFAEDPKEIIILDQEGSPLKAGDNERRYFEGPWMHKYNGKYYFSYSTGDTHYICYAIGDSPYGPFTYQGKILDRVIGWTTHHSIVEFEGRWYLYYHDSSLSNGVTHLRCIKVTELFYKADGTIETIFPYGE